VGEHRRGHGAGVDDFVFVGVGTGVGMGIVAGGRLQRGAFGAAGEIATLPIGETTLEAVAGGEAVAGRFSERAGEPTGDAQQVFEAAERGDEEALAVLAGQADALARGLVAVQSVLDPALVVLGGGMGSRRDVADRVARRLHELTPRPPALLPSALGERAGVVGAIELAREQAQVAEQEPVDA
jgi:glucokinase